MSASETEIVPDAQAESDCKFELCIARLNAVKAAFNAFKRIRSFEELEQLLKLTEPLRVDETFDYAMGMLAGMKLFTKAVPVSDKPSAV